MSDSAAWVDIGLILHPRPFDALTIETSSRLQITAVGRTSNRRLGACKRSPYWSWSGNSLTKTFKIPNNSIFHSKQSITLKQIKIK